jgi:hypothetical protein
MMPVKRAVRAFLPASTYDWLWARYQSWRRLFGYPPGADLLNDDYDAYWRERSRPRLGQQ